MTSGSEITALARTTWSASSPPPPRLCSQPFIPSSSPANPTSCLKNCATPRAAVKGAGDVQQGEKNAANKKKKSGKGDDSDDDEGSKAQKDLMKKKKEEEAAMRAKLGKKK